MDTAEDTTTPPASTPIAGSIPPPLTAAWVYPVALAVLLLGRWFATGTPGVLSGWLLVPAQLLFLTASMRMVMVVPLERWRRRAWWCLIVAALLDFVANASWTYLAASSAVLYGTVADLLFDLNYVALVAACACFYRARGGRFRSTRSVVDVLTLALGAGASLLPFLLSPVLTTPAPVAATLASFGYTFGIGSTAIMGAFLYMQIMDWRDERPIAWVLLGIAVIVCADLFVASMNIRGDYVAGGADVIASCSVYTAFTTAAYAQYLPARPAGSARPEAVHSFVPITSLFVAIAIVLGAEFNQAPGTLLLAAGLSLVAAMLLVMRQFRVRVELERLNRELAAREAEARVSELVRRSSDVIAVIDRSGAVRYVSPASQALLGRAPEVLAGMPAPWLFGAEHAPAVRELLDRVAAGAVRADTELRLILGQQERIVQVTVSDESRNDLIEGQVLTVRDLTELRLLERELLDIATRERQRLCGDIHEGLGQQLTGIGLYLSSMNNARKRDPSNASGNVEPVIALVNAAIEQVRALARGLSPLEVVHRSLETALRALVADVQAQFPVQVTLDADIEGEVLSDLEADHLYRIIQEAVLNACRHAHGRTIGVRVRVDARHIVLAVSDDGVGMVSYVDASASLGLRMMRYRVQLLGGTIRFGPGDAGGTCVSVEVRRQRPQAA